MSGEAILSAENSGKPLSGRGAATNPAGGAHSAPEALAGCQEGLLPPPQEPHPYCRLSPPPQWKILMYVCVYVLEPTAAGPPSRQVRGGPSDDVSPKAVQEQVSAAAAADLRSSSSCPWTRLSFTTAGCGHSLQQLFDLTDLWNWCTFVVVDCRQEISFTQHLSTAVEVRFKQNLGFLDF